jgi:hypothetical protein
MKIETKYQVANRPNSEFGYSGYYESENIYLDYHYCQEELELPINSYRILLLVYFFTNKYVNYHKHRRLNAKEKVKGFFIITVPVTSSRKVEH